MARAAQMRPRTSMRVKDMGLWQDIFWEAYGRAACQTAMSFAALRLKPGQTVAIIGENCPQ
ncbi:hypothetical protein DFAR_920016 [Desulfarculales bacterium]